VQEGNTKDLLFGVARLISDLSGIIALHPGDLIFTGTPEGIGELRQIFVAADEHGHAPRSQRPAPAPEVAS
jgi:2-keto-4-pentenoate hydratase/2-oxohepta-3-ene-1,7-dioic acid hydratase in catechol pathway